LDDDIKLVSFVTMLHDNLSWLKLLKHQHISNLLQIKVGNISLLEKLQVFNKTHNKVDFFTGPLLGTLAKDLDEGLKVVVSLDFFDLAVCQFLL
jgi:hypothetical protein